MPIYRADEYPGLSHDTALAHYGIIRRSGRYPWGSGGDDSSAGAAERSRTFFGMVSELEKKGLSRPDIARGFGMTTTQLRDATTIAKNAQRREDQLFAEKLRAKGWSASAIGREFNPPKNESSVRQLLDPSVQERTRILENTVQMLRDEVDAGGWISVGKGTEYYVSGGVSKEKLRAAVSVLKDEGYAEHKVQVDQAGTANKTTYKVLCPPGTTYKDVVTSKEQIRELLSHTEDGGRSFGGKPLPPMAIDPKRVKISYKEDGGAENDGVVFVRPGVKDVHIGGSSYAQVRIDVGGTHYIKGMAMYKDDLPAGVDLLVQSNKKRGTPMMGEKDNTVLKLKSDDPDMPFGAAIRRQITELGPDGKERLTSAMNILQEEGAWDGWSRGLSSQVISKQSAKLAERQLGKVAEKRKREYDEIMALTNPTVKAKLLQSFSDAVDSDAVHLSAAGLPRSSYHVILPFNGLKDTEVYAPNFNQGEKVALIRYPHGGTFEIPVLTVNNNHPPAVKAIGRAKDAVGINSKVAERMSGADFDGDFVMVIPNDRGDIKSTPPLKKLEGFDPQSYKLPSDAPRMTARQKATQMGKVSNLITDMTIRGANNDEIARAVKHSMVVIDAEKHHLDWKRSAQENGISALQKRYQFASKSGEGASTLISRATSTEYVDRRKPRAAQDGGPIDKATGKLVYTNTGESYVNRRGKTIVRTTASTKLAETDDARSLSSGTLMERVYADHSNKLKAMANRARKEMVNGSDGLPQSDSAKRVYKDEVKELKTALDVARMNSPRERQAQVLANTIIRQKMDDNPTMEASTLKKVKAQALTEARYRMNAKKQLIELTDRQWEAIQAGAVSKTMLREILENTNIERVKELATPRSGTKLSGGDVARARSLEAQGLTQADIARVLGVSLTTLKKEL